MALRIVVLEGDQTGQELLDQALRVIAPDAIGLEVELARFDLSLENRRRTRNEICTEAATAMARAGFGIKAATITPEGADDVGSPNRLIREAIDGKVIVRTGRRIPGVSPVAGIHHPISVVRMAVEDAYGAQELRRPDNGDELAERTEVIHRSNCRAVAEYAFRTARQIDGRVYGGPKWTVSPVYEGMLKEEMDAAAERHPEIAYEPLLIDATYAGLLTGRASEPLVIPCKPRRRPALGSRPPPLWIDRRCGVGAPLPRRRPACTSRDVRGSARDRPGTGGKGHRQPDGDDLGGGGRPSLRGRGRRGGS